MNSISGQSLDSKVSRSDAILYWESVAPNIDGIMGGFPQISPIDIRGSINFLAKLRRCFPSRENEEEMFNRGVDCGAGIGRVTAGLLSKVCEIVDVVEPVEKFARAVGTAKMMGSGQLGKTYVVGLEDWIPEEQYDLIWNQWCLGHLTDNQLLDYLKRCSGALMERGWIVVKENISTNTDGTDIFDPEDSSITRADEKFRDIFHAAGLVIVKQELQRGIPKGLYPVRCYALQPGP